MADGKITEARIGDKKGHNGNASVHVKIDGGEEQILFHFYDDEIRFDASEFIGKTKEEAKDLKYEKDAKWLRSSSYEAVK